MSDPKPGKRRGPKPGAGLDNDFLAALELTMVEGSTYPEQIVFGAEWVRPKAARTVDDYIARIRTRWAREAAERRPADRDQFRAMLMLGWKRALRSEAYIAAAQFLKVLARLDGLEAPVQVQVAVAVMDIRAMTPKERETEIERLLVKRAEALDGRATSMALPPAPSSGGNGSTKH